LVGGELCLNNRTFLWPMHPECARYSIRACPYLSNPQAKHRPGPKEGERALDPLISDERPAQMFLFITRGYKPVVIAGSPYIKAAPFAKVEPL
jgi:hypothetical protein